MDEDQPVMTVRLAQTAASSTGWTKLGIVASRQMQEMCIRDRLDSLGFKLNTDDDN